MDHVAGPLRILLAEKEGRIWFNVLCLKLYQFERITWWCLSVLEYVLQSTCNLSCWKKTSHGLPKFREKPWNLIHNPPCRIPCKLFIYEIFFGPLGLHLRVWSELGRWSPPFRPIRALRLQWSRAFSLVCEVALRLAAKQLSFLHTRLPLSLSLVLKQRTNKTRSRTESGESGYGYGYGVLAVLLPPGLLATSNAIFSPPQFLGFALLSILLPHAPMSSH